MCSGNCNCGSNDLNSYSANKNCSCGSSELISKRNYFRLLSGPVYEFGIGNLTPNAILGAGNEAQAPACWPNQSEITAPCNNNSHQSGSCTYMEDGTGLMCSNYTGGWCWTSGLNCPGAVSGGVKHVVPPLL
jgi:hypothetical protein